MAKLKLMCALVAELLMKCREEEEPAVELNGNHFVLWQPTADTIVVCVEDKEFGLIRYDIKFTKNPTVREVFNHSLTSDLLELATIEGKSMTTGQTICCGDLFYEFAGDDAPISHHYEMDLFRDIILRFAGKALNIIA